MKKKNFCTVLALAFFIMSAESVSAQVTIGDNKTPETFSQLEIVSGNKTGLRLPQITTTEQRDEMFTDAVGFKDNSLSKGLQIFNMETGCVETWNGTKWIQWCDDASSSGTTSATATNANNNPVLNIDTEIDPAIVTHTTTGATGIGTPSGLPPGVIASWVNDEIVISGTPTESGTFEYIIPLLGGNNTETATGTITVKNCAGTPATPGAISGIPSTAINFEDTFTASITAVTGATSYVWTLPNGLTGTSTTTSITITGATAGTYAAGTIKVAAVNDCGTSATSNSVIAVTVNNAIIGCTVNTVGGGTITFMNYNLGANTNVQTMTPAQQAAHTTPGDNFGYLYQWGRVADGHQIRTSLTVYNAATAFDENSQASASTHKGKFITGATDWHSPQNDDLWNFTTYPANNPCPTGWRVPTTTELQSIFNGNTTSITSIPTAGKSMTSGNYIKWTSSGTNGWLVYPNTTGAGEPTLFLPAAFQRSYVNGVVQSNSYDGYYWSSSVDDTKAYFLSFSVNSVTPSWSSSRGNGNSVRCVAE